jgi:hypothetical protein
MCTSARKFTLYQGVQIGPGGPPSPLSEEFQGIPFPAIKRLMSEINTPLNLVPKISTVSQSFNSFLVETTMI